MTASALTLTVQTADLAACVGFYVDVVGCTIIDNAARQADLAWPSSALAAGRLRLVQQDPGGVAENVPPGRFAIAVEVNDVDRVYGAAQARGCPLLEPLRDRGAARCFTVADPSRMRVEICSRVPAGQAPEDPAWELLAGRTDLRWPYAVRVAATLRLADLISVGAGQVTELAALTGTDHVALGRLLRYLACRGVFAANGTGRFAMSPAAALLMDGHSSGLRAWLDLEGAGGRMDQAFAGLLDVVRSGKPAYPAQFGREFWADLGSSPELARSFDTLMAGHSQRFAPDVVAAYDWAGVRLAVDVGGGTGGLLAELVRRHPHIEGVLVDQASAAATARQRFADEGISDRATVVVGDFFGPLPSSGSAYLLARILHDWSDRDAVRILRNCATAGGPDSRVLVIEAAPAADADISRLTSMDLRMLVVYGGRERTTEEIAALADQAGLATHTTMSTPSGLTIVDMRRAPA